MGPNAKFKPQFDRNYFGKPGKDRSLKKNSSKLAL